MSKQTPRWEKFSIVTSALAALAATLIAMYQGYEMKQAIIIDQATSRPFLVIEPAKQPIDLSNIVIQVKNTGSIPGRILRESGKTWIGGMETRTSVDSDSEHLLYPNEDVVICEVTLDSPESILSTTQDLRVGYCVLYESGSASDRRKWLTESWFILNHRNHTLHIWKRDETEVKETAVCDIESAIPTNWLSALESIRQGR